MAKLSFLQKQICLVMVGGEASSNLIFILMLECGHDEMVRGHLLVGRYKHPKAFHTLAPLIVIKSLLHIAKRYIIQKAP